METMVTRGEKKVYEEGKIYTKGEKGELIDLPLSIVTGKFTIAEEQIVQRRTITRDEAKQAIIDLFTQRKELDYVEIMSELGLELKSTIEICRELEKEGKIKAITK